MSKESRNLLLVDDDTYELDRVKLFLSEINKGSDIPFKFNVLTAVTASDALDVLRERFVDCAIIDLRLPRSSDGKDDADAGNQLLRDSLQDNAIPHVIHSAHIGELADGFEAYHIKIVEKEGGDLKGIFDWFFELAPLINVMAAIRQDLMRETALLFHRSIRPHWENKREYQEGDDGIKKIILRQIVSHLAEHFSLPLYGAPSHHLDEVYFRPPLREDKLHTGDLIQYDGEIYVIVTPQCNMVNKYPDHFLIAKCCGIENEEISDLKKLHNGNRKEKKQATEKFRNLANQQLPVSEHFLPPCGEDGPWKVNFKIVRSVSKNEADTLLANRLASITPQFIPNLVQRFAAYIGRLGQPDLNVEELGKSLCE